MIGEGLEQRYSRKELGAVQPSTEREVPPPILLQEDERVFISRLSRRLWSWKLLDVFSILIKEEKVKRCKPRLKSQANDEQVEEVHRCFIQPSFLSWYFEFQVVRATHHQTLFTAKPIHFIDQHIELILRQVFFDKDLVSLRRMFNQGVVTLGSLTMDGMSLLLVCPTLIIFSI